MHPMAFALQRGAHEAANGAFVLDDQHGQRRLRGGDHGVPKIQGSGLIIGFKRRRRFQRQREHEAGPAARPGSSARICPPWASMIARQIASPRPTPGTADSA
jgi:hypothetical protein